MDAYRKNSVPTVRKYASYFYRVVDTQYSIQMMYYRIEYLKKENTQSSEAHMKHL